MDIFKGPLLWLSQAPKRIKVEVMQLRMHSPTFYAKKSRAYKSDQASKSITSVQEIQYSEEITS